MIIATIIRYKIRVGERGIAGADGDAVIKSYYELNRKRSIR